MAKPWEKASQEQAQTPMVSTPVKTGTKPWERQSSVPSIVPHETIEEPTLGSKLKGRGTAMVKHGQEFVQSKGLPAFDAAEYLVNQVGEGAGGIGDILGAALKTIGKPVEKVANILAPQSEESKAKWGTRAEMAAKAITPAVQSIQKLEAKNPKAGELVRNIANITTVLPMAKGLSSGIKAGLQTTKNLGGIAKGAAGIIAEPIAGAPGVKQALQGASKQIYKVVLRPSTADVEDGLNDAVITWAQKRGIGGNIDKMKDAADNYHQHLSNLLKARMEGSNKTVDLTDAWMKTMGDFTKAEKTFGQNKPIQNALKEMTTDIEAVIKSTGSDVDVVTANDLKRLAGKNGAWIHTPKGAIPDPEATAKGVVYDALYKNLKASIEKAAPEVHDINQEFMKLIPLERSIVRRSIVGGRQEFIPLKTMISGVGAVAAGSPTGMLLPASLEVANRLGKSGGFAQGMFNLAGKADRSKAAREIKDVSSLMNWIKEYEPGLATLNEKEMSLLAKEIGKGTIKGPTQIRKLGKDLTLQDEINIARKKGMSEENIQKFAPSVRKGMDKIDLTEYKKKVVPLTKDILKYLAGLAIAKGREAVPQTQENQ